MTPRAISRWALTVGEALRPRIADPNLQDPELLTDFGRKGSAAADRNDQTLRPLL